MSPMGLIQSPYFATGNPETEEYTTLPYPGMLGCVAEYDKGGRAGPPNKCRYQLVKQAASIQGIVGNAMYWSNKGLYTVTTDSAAGQFAGVCRIAAAAAASYIWILKKGDATGLYVGSPASTPDGTGQAIVASTEDGKFDCVGAGETQAAYPLVGSELGIVTSNLGLIRFNVLDSY